jgi:hypothetical protein
MEPFVGLTHRLLDSVDYQSLPPCAKDVLVQLLRHSNHQYKPVWPSVATLSTITNQCENSVRKALQILERVGFISITIRKGASNLISFIHQLFTPAKVEPPPPQVLSQPPQILNPNKKQELEFKQQQQTQIKAKPVAAVKELLPEPEIENLATQHHLQANPIKAIISKFKIDLQKLAVILAALKVRGAAIKNPYGFITKAIQENWQFPDVEKKLSDRDRRRTEAIQDREWLRQQLPQFSAANIPPGADFRSIFDLQLQEQL